MDQLSELVYDHILGIGPGDQTLWALYNGWLIVGGWLIGGWSILFSICSFHKRVKFLLKTILNWKPKTKQVFLLKSHKLAKHYSLKTKSQSTTLSIYSGS